MASGRLNAAKLAVWRSWTGSQPETFLEGPAEAKLRRRFQRLYQYLSSEKLQVRVLPDEAFGLIHGKAGVITLADGSQTCFILSKLYSFGGVSGVQVWFEPMLGLKLGSSVSRYSPKGVDQACVYPDGSSTFWPVFGS
jgi:hypothetical protein